MADSQNGITQEGGSDDPMRGRRGVGGDATSEGSVRSVDGLSEANDAPEVAPEVAPEDDNKSELSAASQVTGADGQSESVVSEKSDVPSEKSDVPSEEEVANKEGEHNDARLLVGQKQSKYEEKDASINAKRAYIKGLLDAKVEDVSGKSVVAGLLDLAATELTAAIGKAEKALDELTKAKDAFNKVEQKFSSAKKARLEKLIADEARVIADLEDKKGSGVVSEDLPDATKKRLQEVLDKAIAAKAGYESELKALNRRINEDNTIGIEDVSDASVFDYEKLINEANSKSEEYKKAKETAKVERAAAIKAAIATELLSQYGEEQKVDAINEDQATQIAEGIYDSVINPAATKDSGKAAIDKITKSNLEAPGITIETLAPLIKSLVGVNLEAAIAKKEATAATKIQSRFKGYKARKDLATVAKEAAAKESAKEVAKDSAKKALEVSAKNYNDAEENSGKAESGFDKEKAKQKELKARVKELPETFVQFDEESVKKLIHNALGKDGINPPKIHQDVLAAVGTAISMATNMDSIRIGSEANKQLNEIVKEVLEKCTKVSKVSFYNKQEIIKFLDKKAEVVEALDINSAKGDTKIALIRSALVDGLNSTFKNINENNKAMTADAVEAQQGIASSKGAYDAAKKAKEQASKALEGAKAALLGNVAGARKVELDEKEIKSIVPEGIYQPPLKRDNSDLLSVGTIPEDSVVAVEEPGASRKSSNASSLGGVIETGGLPRTTSNALLSGDENGTLEPQQGALDVVVTSASAGSRRGGSEGHKRSGSVSLPAGSHADEQNARAEGSAGSRSAA